jgi:hypothetical protein
MSAIKEEKLLHPNAAETRINNVEILKTFFYCPDDFGEELGGATPKQLVSYLHKHKNTLQHLELNYFGVGLRSDYDSWSEGKAFAVGSGLADFTKLESLDMAYAALFDRKSFISTAPARPFLPTSISSFTLRACPLKANVDFLKAIIAHKQRNTSMTIHLDFDCEWVDLGSIAEIGGIYEGKSKLDEVIKLAKETGIEVGCAGGELESWPSMVSCKSRRAEHGIS